MEYMRIAAQYIWTGYKKDRGIEKELNITTVLEKKYRAKEKVIYNV
jgi:hypothetical protein